MYKIEAKRNSEGSGRWKETDSWRPVSPLHLSHFFEFLVSRKSKHLALEHSRSVRGKMEHESVIMCQQKNHQMCKKI